MMGRSDDFSPFDMQLMKDDAEMMIDDGEMMGDVNQRWIFSFGCLSCARGENRS